MRPGLSRRARAQSETVGIVLLIAVVVVLVIGAGAVVIADWQTQADRETRANVASDLTATNLTLQHMGGDSLAPEDVLVVLQGPELDLTLDDEDFTSTAERFEAGSTWRYGNFSSTLDGVVTLRVFYTPTNALLHEATYEVGEEGLVLEVDGETESATIRNGTTVEYTVERTFVRGSPEDVTENATLDLTDEDVLERSKSPPTVTAKRDGQSTITAELDGQTATVDVTVVDESTLAVTDVSVPTETERGDDIDISGTVENTGSETAEDAEITLTVEDEDDNTPFSETDQRTISTGESVDVTFVWNTTGSDAGEYTATIATEDDSRSEAVTLVDPLESALLEVREGAEPIGKGESFDQHLTWENVYETEETITLVVNGTATEPTRTTIEIDPGESVTPETLGFPDSGVLVRVVDKVAENTVYVTLDEQ